MTAITMRARRLLLFLGILLFGPLGTPFAAETGVHALKTARLMDTDTIVLGDFDNRTGETVFDGALKQALALAIGQSPFLNVLSERTISETLRIMGRPATERITADVGRDLCLRAGSKAVLGGAISKFGSHYLLELTAVDCRTGKVVAKAQRNAENKDDVLKALSQASFSLRTSLGEARASVQEFNVGVEASTHSIEALKNYSVGVTTRREQGDTLSIPFLKRATEFDPDFPLAYAELTAIYRNQHQPSMALEYASKAYQLRARVSEREKLKITGIYLLATGDFEKEIQNYQLWQTKYPRDFVPYNNLGNDYAQMGQLEKALVEYQRALQLVPSVISYVNVVGVDISLNRFDAAGATLDEAFASKLDGTYLRQNLYWLGFLRGNVAQMEQQVAWASGRPADGDALLSMQSDTEAYYGRLLRAQEFTRRAIDSAAHAGSQETAGFWQVNAALRDAEVGNMSAAKQGATAALALSSGRDVKLIAAFTMARAGDNDRAQTLVRELQKEYPSDTLMKLYWLSTINAVIELNGRNFSQALKDLDIAAPYELGAAGTFVSSLYPAYVRGQVYLRTHQADAAAAEFQKLLDHPGIVSNFLTGAVAHLQLGRAYASSGNIREAEKAYQDFLTLWKDADPTISILNQAKTEYAKLNPKQSVAAQR
jgi:eukaryotic-like serine/threonine-protein kinase